MWLYKQEEWLKTTLARLNFPSVKSSCCDVFIPERISKIHPEMASQSSLIKNAAELNEAGFLLHYDVFPWTAKFLGQIHYDSRRFGGKRRSTQMYKFSWIIQSCISGKQCVVIEYGVNLATVYIQTNQ